MAFCSFSKDCEGNSYITLDNKFITKYLPEADGFAVKVYLYGLYLCENAHADYSLSSMAEVLGVPESKIEDAFYFWEEYDLVQVLSKSPFAVQYLPVKSAVGRPKKVRYEQYADFNKELQRKLQKAGKFLTAGDYLKYMRFLEDNAMQPQAFLLIAEYCINKQGEAISHAYIFNKAKKFVREGFTTYELVERELSSYNVNEGELAAVFAALNVAAQKTPTEADYSLYRKWTTTLGFEKAAVLAAAKHLKRGSIASLDVVLEELYEKGKTDPTEIAEYLANREYWASLTFRIGRKLGVKVSNPAPYIEEYTEKWCTYGFDDTSLLDIALFCLKTERNSFDDMNAIIEKLFADGCVTKDCVKAHLKEKNEELKLFAKIQEICGSIRKNATNLSLIRTWRDWKFNDEMILEAAKRSATSASPIPYMNKILSDWKQSGVFDTKNIPDGQNFIPSGKFVNPQIEAINAKADRERYYSLLRERAQAKADKVLAKANTDNRFKTLATELSKMELSLAKAEIFTPDKLPALQQKKAALLEERAAILSRLGIAESELVPQVTCKKCLDTGFMKNGVACDCYKI
ncbi:MAG: DnaD domain protein [Clostridia bacterium]|nr:DnaD domain protein [Clostridia bacterium]